MEIQISFQRKRFSKVTEDFLCDRLDKDTDEVLIQNLRNLAQKKVKKLKAQDANDLLIRIIQSIIINDNLEETINTSAPEDTEHESDSDDEKHEDGNSTIIVTNKIVSTPGCSKQPDLSLPTHISPKNVKIHAKVTEKIAPIHIKKSSNKEVKLCKFFKNGRCNKTKEDCNFDHPRICRKFNLN